jgi:hypothetical protein
MDRSDASKHKTGVMLIGLDGAIGSTVVAGTELMVRSLAPRVGMMTETGRVAARANDHVRPLVGARDSSRCDPSRNFASAAGTCARIPFDTPSFASGSFAQISRAP